MNSVATPLPFIATRAFVQPRGPACCAETLYARVFEDILDRRFANGLSEEAVMQAYDAGRSQVRRVLSRLARQQVILTRPNQRARVAEPGAEQLRQTLQARRLAEASVIQLLCAKAAGLRFEALQTLVASERRSVEDHRQSAAIRLGGEFHLELARMAGNAPLAHFLGGLVPLTGLALARSAVPVEGWQGRETILHALENGNAWGAIESMADYLDRLAVLP
ncbi:GntR family transcriptional regulator [Pseudomonas gingeri]|uniref:GntR family transcriptional regulator n=1 Tax=Pseudomonas gingeri TaxID=117681 RepID=A0A7Y7YBU4_9PSED|nr:GntR family transcriptional regulator [Pseudomonas gingeri]NWB31137.1 GntR family transcriptional regulator [Pseudomonas gingeri]NWC33463.1 GntR family transcriptional regulator [Pseudomonas gingeri]NWD09777.1 GntR family transcriptional regulator [Pseudomonas gingeri]NWD46530.1 GntR family transcriptional regulator [Pseudomonas gingeri]NWE29161.1 GntR family transcriptional regulator [Pseudomonas gingeri]